MRSSDSSVSAVAAKANDELVFGPDLMKSADELLSSEPALETYSNDIGGDALRWLDGTADYMFKLSRRQHLRAIAFAYAVWIRSANNEQYKQFLINLRTKDKRKNSRTTDLHRIVARFINYGEASNSLGSNDQRRLRNRDVCAIKYLHKQRIGPAAVEIEGAVPGEGLDTWSRLWNGGSRLREAQRLAAWNIQNEIEITIQRVSKDGQSRSERISLCTDDYVEALLDELRARQLSSNPMPSTRKKQTPHQSPPRTKRPV